MDYDIDKVSPRPWADGYNGGITGPNAAWKLELYFGPEENERDEWAENDRTSNIISAPNAETKSNSVVGIFPPGSCDPAHIVHCVNAHDALTAKAALVDELVEQLELNSDALCHKRDCFAGRSMSECKSAGYDCGPIRGSRLAAKARACALEVSDGN